ncbi:MAG: ABC transporter permease [Candidatus Bipolaricaulota bacterium]
MILQEAWQFMVRRPDLLAQWTLDHLWLILISNSISMVLAVAIGIWITGRGRKQIADITLYSAEIIMTIPSLAMFGFLMPLFAAIGWRSFGIGPAVVALILYGLLPVMRNTYTAIMEVTPDMVEAGRGMGMSELQILTKVKLPLATPVIMAGLRNAVVINIGIAAIAAMIGAGGLGVPLFRGVRQDRADQIIAGAILVTAMAWIADLLLGLLEKKVTPKGLQKARSR